MVLTYRIKWRGKNAVVNQEIIRAKAIIAVSAVRLTEEEPPKPPPDEDEPNSPIKEPPTEEPPVKEPPPKNVCEDHPDQPWRHDGCGAAGELFTNPKCDKEPGSVFNPSIVRFSLAEETHQLETP